MSPAAAPLATSAARIEPTRLEGFDGGPRFAVWWLPAGREPLGSVLCVQPIGAERAAARHALAAQAWRLARRGWAVLLLDLFGTGDSPGEPQEASLEGWRGDLLRAAMLARQRHTGPNVLWGVRAGALLAADIAVALDQLVDAYVFWQAPADGSAVAAMPAEGGGLAPAMLAELADLHMQPPPVVERGATPAVLFVDSDEAGATSGGISPLVAGLTEQWLEAGYAAMPRTVSAPPFWMPPDAPGNAGSWSSATSAALPAAMFLATEEFLEVVR
ncbi:MAG TPA: CocE/NonD family hydrolase [Zeimonas sp.]|nr:CocE/NonD family hydrolase [Zeimonas sp.]